MAGSILGAGRRGSPGVVTARLYSDERAITAAELQVGLDAWPDKYNWERPHSGRYYHGKSPWESFQQSGYLALEKDLNRGDGQSDDRTLRYRCKLTSFSQINS